MSKISTKVTKPADPTASDSRLRATALRHASNIQDKKRLQTRIIDLILECFDLPTLTPSSALLTTASKPDPSDPSAADASLFKTALSLFQPSDFDDLVYERNVDDRCGYALCPNGNRKIKGAGEKVWNGQGGKGFGIVDRMEMERWCSKRCGERAGFVRAQLGTEPAWLREGDGRVDGMVLLDELGKGLKANPLGGKEEEVAEQMKLLSLERGELNVGDADNVVEVFEKSTISAIAKPPELADEDAVEGYRPRRVRFAESGKEEEDG